MTWTPPFTPPDWRCPPRQVFEMFSPYLTAKVDEKKKRDPAWIKREAIREALGAGYRYWRDAENALPPLDPRWLDVAVAARDMGLVRELARPGHAGLNAFLTENFAETIKKAKSRDECHDVVAAMIRAEHPEATDAFIAAFEKQKKNNDYYAYWFTRLIPDLPKSAIPRLEALVPTLGDRAADSFLEYLQQLRAK